MHSPTHPAPSAPAAPPRPVASRERAPHAATLGMRTRTSCLNHGRCRYVDEGEGRPLLLLHGAPMTSLAFVRMVRALSPHYRVIAPDLPGFGGSDPLPFPAPSLSQYADFVEGFVEALDLRDYVAFVHDSSACIGLAAMARAPRRVAAVVVADTVPLPMTGAAAIVRWVLRYLVTSRPVRSLNRRFNLLPWMVATLAPFLRPFGHSERGVLVSQFDTPEKRDRALQLFSLMARDGDFMRGAAKATHTHLAACPALIMYGQFDPMRFVGGFARFEALLPRATRHVVVGEEHFPMLASGDRVARAVHGWLQTTLPAQTQGGAS